MSSIMQSEESEHHYGHQIPFNKPCAASWLSKLYQFSNNAIMLSCFWDYISVYENFYRCAVPCVFSVDWSCVVVPVSDSSEGKPVSVLLSKRNAGREGDGRLQEWLLSIGTTAAMVGLLDTFSWTHNKPMWKHLITSLTGLPLNVSSIRFVAVPSLQFLHACRVWNALVETNSSEWKSTVLPHKNQVNHTINWFWWTHFLGILNGSCLLQA